MQQFTKCLLISLALLGSAVVGASADPSAARVYVGACKGGHESARMAIAVQDGEFLAYVCSQDDEFNQAHATWFRGTVADDGTIDAANPAKRTLKGKLSDEGGSLTLGGAEQELSADLSLVGKDSSAGLYRDEAEVDDEVFVAGWIVDAEGNVAGAVRGKSVTTPPPGGPIGKKEDLDQLSATVGRGGAVLKGGGIVASPVNAGFRVASVTNLGNNVGDDSTDRIEVKWVINATVAPSVKEYLVKVKVTYADGSTNSNEKTVSGTLRSAEVRVVFKSGVQTKSYDVSVISIPKDPEFGTFRTARKVGNF